jgi:hypothetical protein
MTLLKGMVLDLAASPDLIGELREGDTVRIGDVGMTFHFDTLASQTSMLSEEGKKAFVYLTNIGADVEGYNAHCDKIRKEHKAEYPDPNTEPYSIEFVIMHGPDYGDYVQHLRSDENGPAMMTRDVMRDLLKSGTYKIC